MCGDLRSPLKQSWRPECFQANEIQQLLSKASPQWKSLGCARLEGEPEGLTSAQAVCGKQKSFEADAGWEQESVGHRLRKPWHHAHPQQSSCPGPATSVQSCGSQLCTQGTGTDPVHISGGSRGKLTGGHREELLRAFPLSSVTKGCSGAPGSTCVFSQASWLAGRTERLSLQWCLQQGACFALTASHGCEKGCTEGHCHGGEGQHGAGD